MRETGAVSRLRMSARSRTHSRPTLRKVTCTPSTRSAWLSYVLMKVFRARICLRDIADEPVARIATLARISRDFYFFLSMR